MQGQHTPQIQGRITGNQFEEKECVAVFPSEDLQKEFHQIILDNVKVVLPYQSQRLIDAMRQFISEQDGNLDLIVLGCTDLPSLLNHATSGQEGGDEYLRDVDSVALIDPMDSLLDLCEDLLPKLSAKERASIHL